MNNKFENENEEERSRRVLSTEAENSSKSASLIEHLT